MSALSTIGAINTSSTRLIYACNLHPMSTLSTIGTYLIVCNIHTVQITAAFDIALLPNLRSAYMTIR